MNFDKNITTGRFKDLVSERAYQRFCSKTYIQYDRLVFFIGGVIYILFAALDYTVLENSTLAMSLRLFFALIAFAAVAVLHHPLFARKFETLMALMMLTMGVSLNVIIYLENDPQHPYYVGLIVSIMYYSLLLRVGVFASVIVFLSMLIGFLFATINHIGTKESHIALTFLVMSFTVCLAGIYGNETRRRDHYVTTNYNT